MSLVFLRKAGVSAMILALVAACGAATGSDLVTAEPDGGFLTDSSVGPDVSAHQDAAPGPDAGDSGHVCKAGCTSDFECQMTCPPPPGMGVNCCDIGSGICYAASTFMCGVIMTDAGLD